MTRTVLATGDSWTIQVITPALPDSKAGNRTTAHRWSELYQQLGHRAPIAIDWDGTPADAMVALHAWRSRSAIVAFREQYPERPLVVALTGTDVYRDLGRHPAPTRASLRHADALVGLHDRLDRALPAEFHPKLRTIYQSAPPLKRRPPDETAFDVLVVAHLRDVKDPLRAAIAVRDVPTHSRIRVTLLGRALSEDWAHRARTEAADNDRFRWLGGVDAEVVRDHLARARVLVVSSHAEGGANVISEAVAAGLPIVASHIDGNLGLLTERWPMTFAVGDHAALRELLLTLEADHAARDVLEQATARLTPRFTPQRERAAWGALLQELALRAP